MASASRSAQNGNEDEDDDALLESIPFACVICKKPYRNPAVTKCGHYSARLVRCRGIRKIPHARLAELERVSNVANKLSKFLEKKRERAKKRKERALAEWEEVSESDGDDG